MPVSSVLACLTASMLFFQECQVPSLNSPSFLNCFFQADWPTAPVTLASSQRLERIFLGGARWETFLFLIAPWVVKGSAMTY